SRDSVPAACTSALAAATRCCSASSRSEKSIVSSLGLPRLPPEPLLCDGWLIAAGHVAPWCLRPRVIAVSADARAGRIDRAVENDPSGRELGSPRPGDPHDR